MAALTLRYPARIWTPAAGQLSAAEARQMLRHPAYPMAVLYPAVFAGNVIYVLVLLGGFLVYAPVTLVAANRVAAGTYRRRVRDVLDSTPVDDRQRTVAAILGLLRGSVVVGLLGIAVARWLPQLGALPVVTLVIWLGTIGMNQMTGSDLVHGIAALLRTSGPRRALLAAATFTTAVTALASCQQLG